MSITVQVKPSFGIRAPLPWIALLIVMAGQASVVAQRVTIEPSSALFEFDPYEIIFESPDTGGFSYEDSMVGMGAEHRSGTYFRKRYSLSELARVDSGGGFTDRVALVHGKDRFAPAASRYYRIRRRVDVLPGAVRLVNGNTIKMGEELLIDVQIPEGKLHVPLPPDYAPTLQYKLKLYRIGQPIRGGALRTDWKRGEMLITEPQMRYRQSDHHRSALPPGLYEARLERNGYGYFVADRKKFLVLAVPTPGVLELVNEEDLRADAVLQFHLDTENLPSGLETERYVEIFRKSKYGDLNPPHYAHRTRSDPDAPGTFQIGGLRNLPGSYVAQLTVGTSNANAYVYDRLSFQVSTEKREAYEYLSVGPDSWFEPGEPISIEVDLGKHPVEGDYELVFYTVSDEFERQRRQVADTPVPESLKIKTWKIERGPAQVLPIKKVLPFGTYALRLMYKNERMSNRIQAQCIFRVAPKFGDVELNVDTSLHTGHPVQVEVVLPDGLPATSETSELYLRLTRRGGRVAGCAVEVDEIVETVPLRGRTSVELDTIERAGEYRLELFNANDFTTRRSKLLARRILTVTTPMLENTIRLPKQVFVPEEEFTVNVQLPSRYFVENPESASLLVVREGYVAHGGAVQFSERVDSTSFALQDNNQASFNIKAPRYPGFYEYRLMERLRSGSDGKPVISRQSFQVVDANSPLVIDHGPGDPEPPWDVPLSGYPWVPEGHYADPEHCTNLSVEPLDEEMDLRFVRKRDGQYVPVEGAIDFADGIYLEGRLRYGVFRQYYTAQIGESGADQMQTVVLEPVEGESNLVRSDRLYVIWEPIDEASGQ